jgi:shikimate dehydrogenase
MPPDVSVPYAEVIGDPIAHSKSPLIHRHWLRELGVDAHYRATRVHPDELAAFLQHRRSDPGWRGCNVTIPHKEAALRQVDRLDKRAAAVGAVNCIVPTSDGLVGYNTDVDGIAAALDQTAIEGRKLAIIGAGGAARAALAYAAERSPSEIVLLVRSPEKAAPLRSMVADGVEIGNFDKAPRLLANAAVIINASPLGMTACPEMPDELLAAVALQRDATLFDMVYSPLETKFLSVAADRRLDGLTMLIGQASRAFKLFFGQLPPAADQHLHDLLTRNGPVLPKDESCKRAGVLRYLRVRRPPR